MLNYGHTLGHVLEKLTGYGELLHGEAIAIGMQYAMKVGEIYGKTSPEERERLKALMQRCGLPVEVPQKLLDGKEIYLEERGITGEADILKADLDKPLSSAEQFYDRWSKAFLADKKRVSGDIHFVLLSKMGRAELTEIPVARLVDVLALSC